MSKVVYEFTRHFSDLSKVYEIYELLNSSSLPISHEHLEDTSTVINRKYLWNEPPILALVSARHLERKGYDLTVCIEIMPLIDVNEFPNRLLKFLRANRFNPRRRA